MIDEARKILKEDSHLIVIDNPDNIDFKDWKVINKIDFGIILPTVFKAEDDSWPCSFYIMVCPLILNLSSLLLVSPECPEYLVVDPEDIEEPIVDYLKRTNSVNNFSIIKDPDYNDLNLINSNYLIGKEGNELFSDISYQFPLR